jgi:LysR family transcriptional regulator (chromosome initiation inhibitor)
MLDYGQLATLAAIHRRGSLDLAASELGLTPSAVSQRLKALEERVGCLLIRRGQPSLATEAGLRLIAHADQVALLESTLVADLPLLSAQARTLRIAVNADSLATWVIPALSAVEGWLFDLVIDDQDWSQDWLKRGDVAAAITGHSGPLQGCDTIPLGVMRFHATASPDYMGRWMPDGCTPACLTNAPALTYSDKDRLAAAWIMETMGTRLAYPTHRIANSTAFVDAARAGLGWGMNPAALVNRHFADGSLVEVIAGTPYDVPLYWQVARLTAPALIPLTNAIRKAAGQVLLPMKN